MMEREKIGGVTVEEFRRIVLENIDDVLLKNDSESIDDLLEGEDTDFVRHRKIINPDELEGFFK